MLVVALTDHEIEQYGKTNNISINLIEIYKKAQKVSDPEMSCAWVLDDQCYGEVKWMGLFGGVFPLPICLRHLKIHQCILALHRAGMSVDEIFVMSCAEIQNETVRQGLLLINT